MEEIILSSLVKNEDFVRIAMPFLDDAYFLNLTIKCYSKLSLIM
jgi:hypothetical protein